MPGYMLHLAAAKLLLDKYKMNINPSGFYIGNLLPDAVEDKAATHFRNPDRIGKLVEYPEMDLFLQKYGNVLSEDVTLGFFYHLYIDRKFILDFYPKSFVYLNKEMQEEEQRNAVAYAYIYKSRKTVPLKEFLSEEYYYGDFTRLSKWLAKKVNFSFEFDGINPYTSVKEADFTHLNEVMVQIKKYTELSEKLSHELKVFEKDALMEFFENAAEEWYQEYGEKSDFNFR